MSLGLHLLIFAVLVIKPVYPQTGDTERLDSIWLYFNAQSPGQAAPPAMEIASEAEKKPVAVRKTDEFPKPEKQVSKSAPTPDRIPPREDVEEQPPAVEETVKEAEPVTELVVAKEDKKKPDPPKIEASKKLESLPLMKKEPVNEPVVKADPRENSEIKSLVAREIKKEQAAALNQVPESVEEKVAENIFPNFSEAVKKSTAIPQKDSVKAAQIGQSVDVRPFKPVPPTETKGLQAAVTKVSNTVSPARVAEALPVKNSGVQSGKPSVAAVESKENNKTHHGVINDKPDLKEIFSGFGTEKLVEKVRMTGINTEAPVHVANVSGGDNSGKIAHPLTTTAATPENNTGTGKTAEMKKPGLPEKAEAVTLPRLTGDLKLEFTGTDDLKVTFAFREYLKNRRSRPMSAAEASRFNYITPRIARPKENLLEAVLGTTGEGIYDIFVTPANGKPASGAFLVRIYENSNRSKTKSLGSRSIKDRTDIARILMPEGIFWDDNNYFTGNLEDSDSITKFNTDTGLIWKEYK